MDIQDVSRRRHAKFKNVFTCSITILHVEVKSVTTFEEFALFTVSTTTNELWIFEGKFDFYIFYNSSVMVKLVAPLSTLCIDL